MREFSFPLGLREVPALRPDVRLKRGSVAFVEATNVETRGYGIQGIQLPLNPLDVVAVEYPHPQLVRGQDNTWLFGETSVSILDTSFPPWEPQVLEQYGIAFDSIANITPGGVWDAFEEGGVMYGFNGECVVYRNPLRNGGKLLVSNDLGINTGCYKEGRIFIAGLTLPDRVNEVWQAALETMSQMWSEVGKNTIMWSSVGREDLPLWFMYPDIFPQALGPTKENILDAFRRNELGFTKVRRGGEVLRLLPHARGVVAFANDSVTMLVQADSNEFALPVQQFTVLGGGIPQRGCAGGNEVECIFIDTTGTLWRIGADGQLSRLGFQEYFQDMLDEEIRISYDELVGRYFISGESTAFVLFGDSLYETEYRITSCSKIGGQDVAVIDSELVEDDEVFLVSHPFDMQSAALKTISYMAFFGRGIVGSLVSIDHRYTPDGPWVRSHPRPINREGNVRIDITGLEFRWVLQGAEREGFELDHVSVRYQRTDRRSVRGPDVDTASTGTS